MSGNVFSRLTPYDDEYGSCAETRATLLIYPGPMPLAEVTSRLDLQPTQAVAAGEPRTSTYGRRSVVKTTLWRLSSDGHVRSRDVRRHLDWLLALLLPRAVRMSGIQETPGVRMTVCCAWYSQVGHGGPTLWPEQMKALADLNLECAFDVYFMPEDVE